MRDLGFKLLLLLIVGATESTLGLPILLLTLIVRLAPQEKHWQLVWLMVTSLYLAYFWGFAWWLSLILVYGSGWAFNKMQDWVSSSWLRLASLVLPVGLVVALLTGLEFSWRIVVYGLLSLAVMVLLNRFLFVTKYQKKYL